MPRRPRTPQSHPALRSDDLTHAAYAPAPVARRRALRLAVQADCPDRPGVYRMRGATGLVLYVGKAKRLRTRLLSYFRAAQQNRRRDKQARILRHAHALEWEETPSEFAALLLELREIKRHRPRFNVMMNVDEAPRGWLALSGGALPTLRVVQRTDDPDAVVLYGPFRRVSMLTEAARALADATGVRDCTGLPGGVGARACLRAQLGRCGCGEPPDAYAARVAEVREFLAGRTRAPLDTLARWMHDAAEQWHFEHAASCRAKHDALAWLAGRLERFHAGADRLTFTYRALGVDGTERLYLLRRGTVRAERALPTTDAEAAELAALQQRIFAGPDRTGGDIPTHDLDEFYLVASWFRRHPDELERAERPRDR